MKVLSRDEAVEACDDAIFYLGDFKRFLWENNIQDENLDEDLYTLESLVKDVGLAIKRNFGETETDFLSKP